MVDGDTAQIRFRYRLRDTDLERECVFEFERKRRRSLAAADLTGLSTRLNSTCPYWRAGPSDEPVLLQSLQPAGIPRVCGTTGS
jgi:hypothetical protein